MSISSPDSKYPTTGDLASELEALTRANRILQKRLERSEQTRAEMEESNRRREQMLRRLLQQTEADRSQLQAMNHELEEKLEVGEAALSEATSFIRQAQVQVAKSEKFSALGELVAGVAHEINNPIGCITSNVLFVQEYAQQMLDHLALYQRLTAQQSITLLPAAQAAIADHAEEIELDYLCEDFPKLIESIATSGERITAISQSLRTFARADTHRKQAFDLHQGIDGTLLILRHRLKAVGSRPAIEIEKNYGSIPEIYCFPGQINQVFMNIVANAIDAMEEEPKPLGVPTITITTAMEGAQVVVTITDNAGGMPEQVRSHIFESQFTTKTAGKGTGLGLSIAHQIVTQNHQGTIVCESTCGQGSTFTIKLPIESLSSASPPSEPLPDAPLSIEV